MQSRVAFLHDACAGYDLARGGSTHVLVLDAHRLRVKIENLVIDVTKCQLMGHMIDSLAMHIPQAGMADIGDIPRLAEQLYAQPSDDDLVREPIPLAPQPPDSSGQRRSQPLHAVLSALTGAIGQPTFYGGSTGGPSIRWRSEGRTLLLDSGQDGLRLSVRRTAELEQHEMAIFERGVGGGPGQVPRYADLPYLWQLRTSDQGTPAPPPAVALTAADWVQLEESLRTMLEAWSIQMPEQLGIGDDWMAAFDIINHADEDRRLVVLFSMEDELSLLIHDQDGPEVDGQEDAMMDRGWRNWLPVLRWWQTWFMPGPQGAAAAARLVVEELRFRGADSPRVLSITGLSGGSRGQLALPGLSIGR